MRWQIQEQFGQSYIKQWGQARFGQRGNWERPNTKYRLPQDVKQILNDLVKSLNQIVVRTTTIIGMPNAKHLKTPAKPTSCQ